MDTATERRLTLLRRSDRYAETEALITELLGPPEENPDALVELGRLAFQRRRYARALDHFERAWRLDHDHERALAWRVAALSRLNRFDEAQELAETALATAPGRHLLRVAYGQVGDDRADHRMLLDQVDRVLKEAPDFLEALEWRIFALSDLNRFDEAEAAATEAFRRHPDAAELHVAHSYALYRQARYHEAAQRCRTALELHPEYVHAHAKLIDHLLARTEYGAAREAAEHAVALLPWSSEVHRCLGRVFDALQDHEAALAEFDRVIELDPHIEEGYTWRASTLRVLNRTAEALETCRTGRERVDHPAGICAQQAWCHDDLEEREEALLAIGEAVKIAPYNRFFVSWRIALLRDYHRYAEAEAEARAAVERIPGDAELASTLAWAYSARDRDEEALVWFRRAVEIDPHRVTHLRNLTTALGWLFRYEEAESVLREALAVTPESTGLLEQLGGLMHDQGRFDEAIDAYRSVLRETPQHGSCWVKLIRLLRIHRDLDEAESVARAAIAANPRNAVLRMELGYVLDASGRHEEMLERYRAACLELPHELVLRRQLAIELTDLGRVDEALAVLDGIDDGDFETRWWRISLLVSSRRFEQAVAEGRRAVADFPEHVGLRLQLAAAHQATGEHEAALAELRKAREFDPESRSVLRAYADHLRVTREFGKALELLPAEIERKPNYPELRTELGLVYGAMGRVADKLAQHRRAVELNPYSSNLQFHYIRALRLNGLLDEAHAALTEVLEKFPGWTGLLAEMGRLCDDRNEYEEALSWFDKALARAPRACWILVRKSATLRALGRFSEAEDLLAPELRRRTFDLDLLVEWGWVLRDRGELTRAQQEFEKAAELAGSPRERADVLHCLGWVAFTAGDGETAERRFRAALAAQPHAADAKLGLAWTLVRTAEPAGEAEAERLCREVLAERPRRHIAHTCLGVLRAHQGDLPQAEHHLRRSIEIDPYDGSYVDLGALFVQMDRYDEAEELLRKAVERNWYDSQAHIELGGLYLQRDSDAEDEGADARRAAQHFRQALVIDPARGAAAIGLALALVKAPGDLLAAERVLRAALARSDCDQPRWQLLVALSRLLIERGDATQRRDLHLEALSCAQQAIELAATEPDPYYVAGIAAYKAGEHGPEVQARPFHRRRALRYLRRCLHHDPAHAEARRVLNLAEQSLAVARGSVLGSVSTIVVAGVLLIALWLGFFLTDKVTTLVIGTLTPILVGLMALGFVLPFLVRLKLPGGVEADLSASLSQVTSGPTGEVSIGPGRLVGHGFDRSPGASGVSAGPRGELPRLG
ncbi:tetratricopeptide repeat protein [Amycolatopsis sp. 195334CR]|uniref:tetratricopeptide repeat protein n=1 Tax=Amycolatopsis sp. 195334CR TaxID=2814588 RepID=UPI001A901CEC|nr:tetratricopeptide repeat protein [Amycolatopsis sp. 195334CR]MBN6042074.1 tetratricopeptide repeat protein [Amycolatopsis sp. 195334CR]